MTNVPQEPLPRIQGRQVDSKEEYYFAVALARRGIDYQFHYQIGSMSLDGGVEIDFVVYNPFPVPVEIQADYWHRDIQNEDIRNAAILRYFKREPLVIDAERLSDVEAAVVVIDKEL